MSSSDSEGNNQEEDSYLFTKPMKFLLVLSYVFLGCFTYIPSPTLIDLSGKVHANIFFMPLLFTSRSAGHIVGCICGVVVYEFLLFVSHKLLLFGLSMFVLSATSIGLASATTLTGLLVCFGISGVCLAVFETGVNAICLHSKEIGSPFFQFLAVFYSAGAMTAPLLARYAVSGAFNVTSQVVQFGIRDVHISILSATPVSNLYSFFGGGVFFVSLLWIAIYCYMTSNPPTIYSPDKKEEDIGPVLRSITVLNTSLMTFLALTLELSYAHLIPTYCVLFLNMSVVESCDVLALFLAFLLLGRLISVIFSDRIEPSHMLIFGLTMVFCGALTLYLRYLDEEGIVFWVANGLVGFGTAPLLSSLFAWFSYNIQITHRTVISLHVFGNMVELVVPISLSLYMWKDISTLTHFLTAAATAYTLLYLLQCYIMWIVIRKKNPKKDREPSRGRIALPNIRLSPCVIFLRGNFRKSTEGKASLKEEIERTKPENVLQRLSDIKNRIKAENRGIRFTLENLVFSGFDFASSSSTNIDQVRDRTGSEENI